ncbi:ImmA/IrrE family metallo-endopeptidase [Niallia taxi]|nr:ImmA/IrrE family metallo-endopeptidase [Niallia taxi]MDE5054857.1 ImmA/IrrE family metallo-endopeptidase [Niallia taxi]
MDRIDNGVKKLIQKHNTNNPFKIANELGILVLHENLGNTLGFYSKHFRMKLIHVNENLEQEEKDFVCAHELGHALLHPDANTPFLKRHTLFSVDKIEQEANAFALSLLFHENDLTEQLTIELALNKYGIPQKLLRGYSNFFVR